MIKNKPLIETIAIIAVVFVVLLVLAVVMNGTLPAHASSQVIHFNGQTIDLANAANVQVQSANDQRVFAADEHGGVVTVTTSIVTVTIWMKP